VAWVLSKSNKAAWLRVGGSIGLLTPVSALLFIGLAIASYPEFSWVDNALSDLGVVAGVTSILFNFGLFVSGLFSLVFSLCLFKFLDEHVVGKVGAAFFVLASLALEGIGGFPENVRPFHFVFSVAFFVLVPIALLVIAGYYLLTRQRRMFTFTLLMAFAAAAPWILQYLFHYVSGVAVPEAVSALVASVWVLVLSGKMLRYASRAKTP
jgi:hypothetical membrane protein